LQVALNTKGIAIGRHRVRRLMQESGLKPVVVNKFQTPR